MKKFIKEFYFKDLINDIEWQNKLSGLIEDGWTVISTEAIDKFSIKIKCTQK